MSLLKRIERNQSAAPAAAQPSESSKLQELRVKRSSPAVGSRDAYVDLKNRIQQKLIAELDPSMDITKTAEVRSTIQEMFEGMLRDESIILTKKEKRQLFESIVSEILGFGPIEQFLHSDDITEIQWSFTELDHMNSVGGSLFQIVLYLPME